MGIRTAFFSILALIYAISVRAAAPEVLVNESGVQLHISEFKAGDVNALYNFDPQHIIYADDNEIPSFEFNFAVPAAAYSVAISPIPVRDGKVQAEVKLVRERIIKNIKVVTVGVVFPSNFYNSLSEFIIPEAHVILSFTGKIPLSSNLKQNQRSYFSFIDNPQHLPELIKAADRIKVQLDKIQSEDWYDPARTYLKITASNDAITYIEGSEIISQNPSFSGLRTEYFHLLKDGKEIPVYFEGPPTLSNESKIYFMGTRPKGDTTRYDNYTFDQPYFLYFDEAFQGKRYNSYSFNNPSLPELPYVEYDKHFELEKDYQWGSDVIKSATMFNEGWYWKTLEENPKDSNNSIFSEYLPLLPVEMPEIILNYKTIKYSSRVPLFDVQTSFNNIEVDRFQFKEIINKDQYINPVKAFHGFNNIYLKSIKADEVIGLVSVDYIKVKGKVKPEAYKGESAFSAATGSTGASLSIPGFSSSKIIALDTINDLFLTPSTIRGYYLKSAADINNEYASVSINDSFYVSKLQGLHIISLVSGIYSTKTFTAEQQAADYLNSLPSGSIISAAFSGGFTPGQALTSSIKALGGAAAIGSSEAYAFTCIKGNSSTFRESSSANASVISFLNHNEGNSYKTDIKLQPNKQWTLVVNDDKFIKKASVVRVKESNLRDQNNQADAFIITHINFKEAADSLAAHRKRQGINVVVVDIEDVYKHFSYGKKSPDGIKEFLKYASTIWRKPSPTHLTIMGDASWDNRNVRPQSISYDFIPSWGNPVSDYWFGVFGAMVEGHTPDMIVGRLSVNDLETAKKVVNKIIKYETSAPRPWMKEMLWMSGGIQQFEKEDFYEKRTGPFDLIDKPPFCMDTVSIRKRDENIGGDLEAPEILAEINKGKGLVAFLGHAAASVFDMDGWQAENFNNEGKTGIFTTLSCNTGAFAEPDLINARNETYVEAGEKGFVATLGGTSTGFTDAHPELFYLMIYSIAKPNLALRDLGAILYYGKSRFRYTNLKAIATIEQFSLLGDPLTKVNIGIEPDLYIIPTSISIKSPSGSDIIQENDGEAIIRGSVYNHGFNVTDDVVIKVIRTYNGASDTLAYTVKGLCLKDDFEIRLPVEDKTGDNQITIIVDPDGFIADPDRSNNSANLTLRVFNQSLLALEPMPLWNINSDSPLFRFINPLNKADFEYKFIIEEYSAKGYEKFYESKLEEIIIDEDYIEWKPAITLNNSSNYRIIAGFSLNGSQSKSLIIPFRAGNKNIAQETAWRAATSPEMHELFSEKAAISSNGISIAVDSQRVRLYGINGKGGYEPFARFQVGDEVLLSGDHNELRGFNVVTVPIIKGSAPVRVRTYDTWWVDSSSIKMYYFLKDSVSSNEYVMIATCDESFRIPLEIHKNTSPGSMDSLKWVLKLYGAELTDSLKFGMSYALLGRRGYPIIEESVNQYDTAEVIRNMPFYEQEATFETDLIGPSQEWKTASAAVELDTASFIQFHVLGYNKSQKTFDTLFSNNTNADLSNVNAEKYPYLKLEGKLTRLDDYGNPILNSLVVDFIPAPELVVNSQGTYIEPADSLRGVKRDFKAKIRNISPRTASKAVVLTADVFGKQGLSQTLDLNIPFLTPDEFYIADSAFNTMSAENLNNVEFKINPDELFPEFYYFNNKSGLTFTVIEDTIRPEIKLYANGKLLENNSNIPAYPVYTIELYDNSPIPVETAEKFEFRINRKAPIIEAVADSFRFESYGEQVPLKARLFIVADTLDYDDNSLFVVVRDGSGNSDTLDLDVFVSQNGFIEELNNAPNPALTDTKFKFYYKAPDDNGQLKIDIYNISGQLIKTINSSLSVGWNEVPWDLRDANGSSIPAGVYIFFLQTLGETYAEPQWGKLIIAK